MELKRVVVTGLGAITPLGNDVPTTWDEYLAACQTMVDNGYQPLALDSTYADFLFCYHLDRVIGTEAISDLAVNGGWAENEGVIQAAQQQIDFINAGYLADGATISNCNVTNLTLNCNLREQEYAAGYSVQHAAIGGLVGRNDGDVSNTLVEGTINVPYATDAFSGIGGFIGLNANKDHQNSTVSNSYADVDIVLGKSSGADSFSGAINNFIGNDINEMLITNCAAMGNITGNGSIQLVDLAGYGMALESDTSNSVAYNPRTGEYVYWTDAKDAAYPSAKPTDNIADDLDKFKGEQEEDFLLYDD